MDKNTKDILVQIAESTRKIARVLRLNPSRRFGKLALKELESIENNLNQLVIKLVYHLEVENNRKEKDMTKVHTCREVVYKLSSTEKPIILNIDYDIPPEDVTQLGIAINRIIKDWPIFETIPGSMVIEISWQDIPVRVEEEKR